MNVKTACRTVDLVDAFATVRRPMTLSEVAKVLRAPLSSCFGLVRTLEARGYLYGLDRRRFYPTKRLLNQARIIAAHDPLAERVDPALEALRDATGETVLFGKLKHDKVVYLDIFEGPQTIRYTAQVGNLKPLHSSAMGKALLAALPDTERRRLVEQIELTAITPLTITDRDALLAHLEAGMRRGWQITRSESVIDVMAVASTVELRDDCYGIAVAGPVHRMELNLERIGGMLKATCGRLESADTAHQAA